MATVPCSVMIHGNNRQNHKNKMMKAYITLFSILGFSFGCQAQTEPANYTGKYPIYSFTVKDINGKEFSFESLRGKKILIVNTASKCGLTPQYKDLQALYTQYADKNFIIIGFPANNFLSQEPGTDATIKEFCELNYGVTFPMMSKISVKGKDIAPIYAYLTQKSLNGYADTDVSWNFQKYAINEQGYVVRMWSPKVSPLAPDIVSWITE